MTGSEQDQKFFDWLVLGDHPAALWSACLAQQLGARAAIVPLMPTPLARRTRKGQFFDPEVNQVHSLGSDDGEPGLLGAYFSKGVPGLDIDPIEGSAHARSIYVATPELRVPLQTSIDQVLSTLKYDLSGRLSKEMQELLQVLPFVRDREKDFWRRFPRFRATDQAPGAIARDILKANAPQQLSDFVRREASHHGLKSTWLTSKSHSDAVFKDRDEREFLRALWNAALATDTTNPPLLGLVQALSHSRTAASVEGGLTSFRLRLLEMAKALGVRVFENECESVVVKNKEIDRIELEGRNIAIRASSYTLGLNYDQFRERVKIEGKRRFEKPFSKQALGWRFTLTLSIHAEAVGHLKSQRLVWSEPGAPALDLEFLPAKQYRKFPRPKTKKRDLKKGEGQPAGHESENGTGDSKSIESSRSEDELVYLFVRTLLPMDEETLQPDYQRKMAARMFRQVSELLPFVEYHVHQVFPDFRMAETRPELDEFSEAFPFVSLEAIPDAYLQYPRDGLGVSTPIRSCYLTNGQSYPELGSFGGFAASIEAVHAGLLSQGRVDARDLEQFWSFLI